MRGRHREDVRALHEPAERRERDVAMQFNLTAKTPTQAGPDPAGVPRLERHPAGNIQSPGVRLESIECREQVVETFSFDQVAEK
jgi:hypothetical protein